MHNGIKLNLISCEKLNELTSKQKLDFIVDEVKDGTIIILEKGLKPEEELDLIKYTMSKIDENTFVGLEIETYMQSNNTKNLFLRLLQRTKRSAKMTVIGPASMFKTIHKDSKQIQALIISHKSVSN